MRRLLLFLLSVLNFYWVYAQLKPELMEFSHLRTSNGLTSDIINAIVKDKQGYIWIATPFGLNRYNGYEIKTYKHTSQACSLHNNEVSALYVDKSGTLFVGYQKGFALYNSGNGCFTHIELQHPKKFIIRVDNFVEGANHKLWVGTNKGLFCFDTQTLKAEYIPLLGYDEYKVGGGAFLDSDGSIWFTSVMGLVKYMPSINKFKIYLQSLFQQKPYQNDECMSLIHLPNGKMWIGLHANGIIVFDKQKETFESIHVNGKYASNFTSDEVRSFVDDGKGNIWIAKVNKLNIFNIKTNELMLAPSSLTNQGLNSRQFNCLYKDDEGIIWIGTANAGVNIYNDQRKKFKEGLPEINRGTTLDNRSVKSFLVDAENNLWVGTDDGLNKFDKNRRLVKFYSNKTNKSSNLSVGGVASLYEDKQHRLWIGSWGGGLNLLRKGSNSFEHFTFNNSRTDERYIGDSNILCITDDDSGKLWMGMVCFTIDVFDPNTKHFEHFSVGGLVRKIVIDKKKHLAWCISDDGLYCIDMQTKAMQHFTYDSKKENTIASNVVNGIALDSLGNLWLTTSNGLNYFNTTTQQFTLYNESLGFASANMLCIETDKNGKLWISHTKGISCFDPNNKEVLNFNENDGALYNADCSYQSAMGEMFFGGPNGMFSFFPNEIKINRLVPKVVINGFKIFNKSIEGEMPEYTDTTIETAKQITLSYSQSVFTVDFVALNYTSTEKNNYCYKLEGVDKEWNCIGNQRSVTFSNLPAGRYTFKVIASNNDNVWNKEGASLVIEILPPWWQTLFFKLFVIVLLILAFYLWFKYKVRSLRKQQQILQHTVERRTQELKDSNESLQKGRAFIEQQNEKLTQQTEELVLKTQTLEIQKDEIETMAAKLHQTDLQRIQLLINLSHELRTPLTLIISPLQKILPELNENQPFADDIKLVYKNAVRINHMVNQMLDLRKIEVGAMCLRVSKTEIDSYINAVFQNFELLAKQRLINYTYHSNGLNDVMFIDNEKVEVMLFNLLSNAFKFTPQYGSVELLLTNYEVENLNKKLQLELQQNGFIGKSLLAITVTDTGIGLKESDKEKIFNRFYQVQSDNFRNSGGTGIGLSLTKELVAIHHGCIFVESEWGRGCSFTILLPYQSDQYKSNELISDIEIKNSISIDYQATDTLLNESPKISNQTENRKKTLLLVDDNRELLNFMSNYFTQNYIVECAENGREGLQKAHELNPSLIISDIMMPEMDGFELCKALKTDISVSHIPIILLTTMANDENQIKGLHLGADDYLPKPFNLNVLNARVTRILEVHKQLRETFMREIILQPKDITLTTTDELFLSKAMQLIEDNISNSDFGADEFTHAMNMSASSLYKKLNALTGQTVSIFIRTIRLKRAAQLIKQDSLTVSEIAYRTGFSDPNYFSKCFKEQFAVSPREYKNLN